MRSVGDLILAGFSQLKNARIENLAADPAQPQSGQIWFNTTDNVYRGFNGATVITFATGGNTALILAELDQIEASAGLAADGSYVAPANSTYLGSTTTLAGADVALDAAVKAASDAVVAEAARAQAAESALTTSVSNEVARATAAEQVLTDGLAAEVLRATTAEQDLASSLTQETARALAAEGALNTKVTTEVARAQAAEQVLTDGLAAEVARAQAAESTLTTSVADEASAARAAEAALDGRVTAVEASYIKKDGSVAFTGDQSLNAHKLTNVATPVDNADAANKAYVDSRIGGLGNAFNYNGVVVAGVDEASAFDLSTLANISAGDYYKVTQSGYVKDTASATPFWVNNTDGLVKNITADGWDKFDNTNSEVHGTVNFIEVSGSTDTGFTVDVAGNFKARVSTLETDLVAEVDRATTAESTLTAAVAAEVVRAQAAESALTTSVADEVAARQAADSALATSVSTEATRAQAAEQVLTDGLAAEVLRAQGAEQTLTTSVASEAARAQAAESALTTSLNAEVARAQGIESALQAELDAAESAVGLAADGTFVPVVGSNYLSGASSVVALSQALDTALKALADSVASSTFVYDGSVAATTHTVNHDLGQKYVQVTVVDSADKVILADSITFVSANQLVVEFSSAITTKVIVSR